MLQLFIKSFLSHLKWWLHSFHPKHIGSAPLRLQRLCFLCILYPCFLLLQSVHWLGFLCDEVLFSGYRTLKVKSPIFITGIPRSGTTFLHRTLAQDHSQFTTVSTWEAVLAPSITERVLLTSIRKADTMIGSPIKKSIDICIRKCEGGFSDIHEVGLSVPEEDYLFLLPAGGCFFLSLAFPFSSELHNLAKFDQLEDSVKKPFLTFYRKLLQKHLYFHGEDKRLLSKNAAFSSWIASLETVFPDAAFLVCVREPETALSSQLSSIASAHELFGTDLEAHHAVDQFNDIFSHSYQAIDQLTRATKGPTISILIQSDLRAEPRKTILSALKATSIDPSTTLSQKLNALPAKSSSKHHHSPLENEAIHACMRPAYQSILTSKQRALPTI